MTASVYVDVRCGEAAASESGALEGCVVADSDDGSAAVAPLSELTETASGAFESGVDAVSGAHTASGAFDSGAHAAAASGAFDSGEAKADVAKAEAAATAARA